MKVYPNQWNKRKQIAMLDTGFTKLDNRNNSIVNSKLQEILYRFGQYWQMNKYLNRMLGDSTELTTTTGLAAVSYTHLDVYKRQNMRRKRIYGSFNNLFFEVK